MTLSKQYQRDGRYKSSLLYREIDGNNIPWLLKTGRDNVREEIHAFTEKEIISGRKRGDSEESWNPFMYAESFDEPALAVFDGAQFIRAECCHFSYSFKNPNRKLDALVAVYTWE